MKTTKKQVSLTRLRVTEVFFCSIIFLMGLVFISRPIQIISGIGIITFVLLHLDEKHQDDKTK